jgi:hypothetical protein
MLGALLGDDTAQPEQAVLRSHIRRLEQLRNNLVQLEATTFRSPPRYFGGVG